MCCLGCIKCRVCQMCQASPPDDCCLECSGDDGRKEVMKTVREMDESRRSTNNYWLWCREAPRNVWRKIRIADGKDPNRGVTEAMSPLNDTEERILETLKMRYNETELRGLRRLRRNAVREGFERNDVAYTRE